MIYIGIDPGKQGGLLTMNISGTFQSSMRMPLAGKEIDGNAIKLYLEDNFVPGGMAFIEKVHAMPGQGVTSMFTFGEGYGLIQGILIALQIPFVRVHPKAWQKGLLPTGKKLTPKQRKETLVARARERWPELGKHSGIADAALIADWGRRQNINPEGE